MTVTKRALKRSIKEMGLPIVDNFVVLFRNNDVFSGIALDSAPSTTYIWTFILPIYDYLPFLHMSLGERVASCNMEPRCLEVGIEAFRVNVSGVKTPKELIAYLNRCVVRTEYANWTRYISLIRASEDAEATDFFDFTSDTFKSPAIIANYNRLRGAYDEGGWGCVRELLDSWSAHTNELLTNIPNPHDVYANRPFF